MASIRISIAVSDVNEVLESYDQIQVHRSIAGAGGPFSDITAETPTAAYAEGTNDAPFTLNGLTLELRVDDGATQTFTIAEDDPVYIDPLVDEINDTLEDATASNGGTGNLLITSDTTGTASTIEIVGGTGLTALGLTAGKSTGKDRRITMQEDYTEFDFVDSGGETTYYYKVRYYNSLTGQTSDLSDAIPGTYESPISSDLIVATIDLVELDGQPSAEVLITVSNAYDADALISSSYGVLGASLDFYTDASGHGEVNLVKGSVVDVSIAGTGISRRITVPSSGDTFDLLSSVAVADDIFQIQTPDIPDAIRRS